MDEYLTKIIRVSDLDCDIQKSIAELYLKYYDGSSVEQVLNDLHNKREVILLYHKSSLVGFTTLDVYEREWSNKSIRVIFSGDTIVEQGHWGQQALAFAEGTIINDDISP